MNEELIGAIVAALLTPWTPVGAGVASHLAPGGSFFDDDDDVHEVGHRQPCPGLELRRVTIYC